MPDPFDIDVFKKAFGMPPEEAVAFLESKKLTPSWDWREVTGAAAQRAFAVAKVTKLDLLNTIHKALVAAQRAGTPFEEFRKQLTPTLKAAGWWGKTTQTNPKTGLPEVVQTGSPWRLQTIYRTNVQSAYMAGRITQQQVLAKRRPFWQYVAVGDDRTRPSHLKMNGVVLRADDPFWKTHYPPNGFNCRCRVRTLTQAQIDREGLTVSSSKSGPAADFTPDEGFGTNPGVPFSPKLAQYPKDLAEKYRRDAAAHDASARPAPTPEPGKQQAPPDNLTEEHFGADYKVGALQKGNPAFYSKQLTPEQLQAKLADDARMLDARSEHLFGRVLNAEDYARLAGAPSGAKLTVTSAQYGKPEDLTAEDFVSIIIEATHPLYDQPSRRTITRHGKKLSTPDTGPYKGKLTIHNDILALKKDAPAGLGTRILATQVAELRKRGFVAIETTAEGDAKNKYFQGYKVWPKLGYDAALPTRLRNKLPVELKGATHLRHLMASQQGSEWWAAHGKTIGVTFDLAPDSYSSTFLRKYLERKGVKITA